MGVKAALANQVSQASCKDPLLWCLLLPSFSTYTSLIITSNDLIILSSSYVIPFLQKFFIVLWSCSWNRFFFFNLIIYFFSSTALCILWFTWTHITTFIFYKVLHICSFGCLDSFSLTCALIYSNDVSQCFETFSSPPSFPTPSVSSSIFCVIAWVCLPPAGLTWQESCQVVLVIRICWEVMCLVKWCVCFQPLNQSDT